MLFIQNFISRHAPLLFQIFAGKFGVNKLNCSQNDIINVYESIKFKLDLEYENFKTDLDKQEKQELFLLIFQSFGCIPNQSGVCWNLVLDLLICGVRQFSEKKASLTEYDLSVILLHFWGMSRNAGSHAESRFQNQKLITRALVGNGSTAAHQGAG